MKLKIEDKKNCQKLIKIEVESNKVKAALDEIYKEIGKDAQIAGFRKGKAPRDLLEAHYSDTAKDEIIRKLIWDAYADAVKSNNIDPVSYPIVEDVKLDDNSVLNFTVKIDIKPVISLKPYTKIKIKKISAQVSEEDINKALDAVRESAAHFKTIEGIPAKAGDYIVCDYIYSRSGKPDETKKNAWIYIDEKSDSSPIPKALIGCNKGQVKECTDKDGLYKITINEIKEKILPQLNDDLAKQVGNFKDLTQLQERLKEELSEDKLHKQHIDMENQIFTYLLDTNQFDVPESVVQRQLDNLVNDSKVRLSYQGYNKEDIEAQQDKLKEALAINAKTQVKIFFILEEIAQREKMIVEEGELNETIEKMSKNAKSLGKAQGSSRASEPLEPPVEPQDKEKFKQALEKQGLLDNLKEQLLHDKVIEFLLKEANIIENQKGKTKNINL